MSALHTRTRCGLPCLEIKETAPGRYSVLWRTPLLSGMRLPVVLQFPDDVRNVTDPVCARIAAIPSSSAVIEPAAARTCGQARQFPGLQVTITDVLVRVRDARRSGRTDVVRPAQPWFE